MILILLLFIIIIIIIILICEKSFISAAADKNQDSYCDWIRILILSFHFFCHGQFRTIFLLPLRVSVNYHLILFLIQSNFYTFLLQLKKLLSCHYLSSSYYRFLLLLLLNDNLFKQHNTLSLSLSSRSY